LQLVQFSPSSIPDFHLKLEISQKFDPKIEPKIPDRNGLEVENICKFVLDIDNFEKSKKK